ncbi:hypothetical protein, partial [Buchananella hordeovulneris]|uniref:hypothetical protein n=1 Tax=Buchananella hordeovulneris TaxID=52770 RepID=UPI001C9E1EE9
MLASLLFATGLILQNSTPPDFDGRADSGGTTIEIEGAGEFREEVVVVGGGQVGPGVVGEG